jgi:hypothetical protein
MPDTRSTTVRFSDPIYRRLEQACEHAGLTMNALVVVACLEWLDRHQPWTQHAIPPIAMAGAPLPFWRRMSELQTGLAEGQLLRRTRRRGEQPFDRFTGRAKNALALAQADSEETERSITPLHLLLGLVLEGQGLASEALAEAGVTSSRVQQAIDALPREGTPGQPDKRLKHTLELAIKSAESLGHRHIGTEHLLLGLIREGGVPLLDQPLEDSLLRRLRAE